MATVSSGPRFSDYTTTNHQAPVWIVTSLSLIYSISFLLVRVLVKIKFWGPDDIVLGLAYVVGIAQWITMYVALDDGAGKDVSIVDAASIRAASKLAFASRLMTIFAIGLSKLSVVLILAHVFTRENRRTWLFCMALAVLVACWTIISTLALSIGCSPYRYLGDESLSKCDADIGRWKAIAAIDFCLETLLAVLPAYLFSRIRMSITRKFAVTISFFFRIGVAGISIAYLESYIRFRKNGKESIGAIYALMWQQMLLAYALMSATIPCLKGFLGRFQTGDLARLSESATGYDKASNSRVQNYALTSVSRRGPDSNMRSLKYASGAPSQLRPEAVEHLAVAHSNRLAGGDDGSARSFGSERMIIHRKVEWDVVPE